MLELKDILRKFLFDCEVNYAKRTIKSYKNSNALFHNYLKQELNIETLEELQGILR
ncbi:hypothetical protein LGK95_18115 [Clostridium algoriphilum]|uniref:hypothetical protein n=1 Tax=Clostridium algoriphilum TaxID=198347 RepID=UPI001CF48728|nr:hypothetical protein [Clostridium algoriphilum]MCB2295402.1 hypothetical protein [Clostridium algoriphilum]